MKRRIISWLLFFNVLFSLSLFAQKDSIYSSSDDLIAKGIEFHNRGDYNEAIRQYKKVCECDPDYGRARYEMALSYYYMDSMKTALEKCKEAILLKYDNVAVYSLIGSMLDNLGKSQEGINVLSDALIRWPYNQNLLYNLAVCYLNISQPEEAEKVLTESIHLNPYHTRSHLALAKANYMMGRIAKSYLAYNMVLLLNPSIAGITSFEEAITKKPSLVCQAYKYPYPPNIDSRKWDELTALLQSGLAFSDDFDYDYDVSYLITRQSLMLFRKMNFDPEDTSLYNQLYVRLFSTIYQNKDFETYLNYILKNTNNTKVADWLKKNEEKLNKFVNWAKLYLNKGRTYGFSFAHEKEGKENYHFDEDGDLVSIGISDNENGEIKEGDWLFLRNDGSVREKGKYIHDKAEGEWFDYWPNGILKQHLSFKNDELEGNNYYYYPNGAIEDTIGYVHGNIQGKFNKYSPSGFLILVNNYSEGKADGPGLFYNMENGYTRSFNYSNDELTDSLTETWLNGKPKLAANYKNGLTEGMYRMWYSNGSRESEMNYIHDTLAGKYYYYYPNNKMKYTYAYNTSGKLAGNYYTYDRDGNISAFDSSYIDGKLEGTRIEYFPNGTKQNILTYDKDRLTELECYDKTGKLLYSARESDSIILYKSFYANGILQVEGLIKNGKNEGKWKSYNAIGLLTKESQYSGGFLSDLQRTYYANGQTKKEYACDSNLIVGEYKEFYINGKLKSWGYYDKSGQTGKWIDFYNNDSIESLSYFSEGKMVGRNIIYHPNGMIQSETFYNQDGTPVRSIYYHPDGRVSLDADYEYGTHSFEEYYSNGQIKEIYNISDNYLNGIRESYYPNGQLASRIHYDHKFINGMFKNWDYLGNITLELVYSMNMPEGKVKWYKDSKIDYIADYEYGITQDTMFDYYLNGKISRKMEVQDDERQGYSYYYAPDGTLMFRLHFDKDVVFAYSYLGKDGKFVSELPISDSTSEIIAYYPNGRISAQMHLKHGLYNGKLITYYPTGTKLRETTYVEDDNEGYDKKYYPNNMLKELINYHSDHREGLYESYYENGKKQKTGNYYMDNEEGDWQIFNSDGKLKETLTYHNGALYEIKKK